MHACKQLLFAQHLTGVQSVAQNHIPPDKKRTNRGWQTVHKLPVTASKIRKLKCKAGLSSTLMKSHIKPSRESVCAGGNKSEARPTGSSASYLVSLLHHYHYLACHSPHNFLPFLSLFFFCFSSLHSLFLESSLFLIFFAFSPAHFLSLFLLPSGCFLSSLSICRFHIWQLSAPDSAWLAGRKRVR